MSPEDETQTRREKPQGSLGRGPASKGPHPGDHKDDPANRRSSDDKDGHKGSKEALSPGEKSDGTAKPEHVDRPGFDLGGSTGKTSAGKGLGLGVDAKKNRKGWGLPR